MIRLNTSVLLCLLTFQISSSALGGFEPIRVSRSGWNARPAKTSELSMDSQSKTRFMIGHHGVTSRYRDIGGDLTVARSIQDAHMGAPNKWADIGYHLMVGKNGTILEGRDVFATSTCNPDYNAGAICAIFLGCYDDRACNPANVVTNAMIFAMSQAIAEKAYLLSMPDLGRHNIQGISELGGRYPNSPGNRIMGRNATGFIQIDVIAELARRELAKLRRDEL